MYPTSKVALAKPAAPATEEDRSFASFFKNLPETVSTVRLFDRSEFYTCYGQDAILLADIIFHTQTVLKSFAGMQSLNISHANTVSFLRSALTWRRMRVEIYAKSGSGSNSQFKLVKTASPGNWAAVEDMLSSEESAVVIALKIMPAKGLGDVNVQVAFADSSEKKIGMCQVADTDSFVSTESLLIQLGVKEVLLPNSNDPIMTKLRQVVERSSSIYITTTSNSDWRPNNVEQDLKQLLGLDLLPSDILISPSSTAAILSYLALPSEVSVGWKTESFDPSMFMRLDASACKALSLFPDPTIGGKNTSLFSLLNKCKTSQGSRLLGLWLKQPLLHLQSIVDRQKLVGQFVSDEQGRMTLQKEYLASFPDMHRICRKLQKGNASLEDVVRVFQVAGKIPALANLLEENMNNDANMDIESGDGRSERDLTTETYIKPLLKHAQTLEKFVEMVETTIDLSQTSHHTFVIRPQYSSKLSELSEQLSDATAALDDQFTNTANKLGLDMGKKIFMENHSSYGYCLRVTKAESKKIEGKSSAYPQLSTQKSGVYFTTPALRSAAEEYKSLMSDYSRTQTSLVSEVVKISATYCPCLEQLDEVIAHLDVIVSMAHVAATSAAEYTRPSMLEKGTGDLVLKDARHPCLEVMDGMDFIPNDLTLAREKSEFLIITGPNMGGKSTYIRQAGVIALMAQTGSFVPCSHATVPIFDCILARVGAGDSQLKGISTFMAEMLETASILKTATKDSLIIIDELGRGTSTYDGFGLAWAISEHITTQIHAFGLFATHFHELTALAAQIGHVKNLHVSALVKQRENGGSQDKDVTLLYKVEPGLSDQSFGIAVAELAGFPQEVIELAKRKAEELEDYEHTNAKHGIEEGLSPEIIEEGTLLAEKIMKEVVAKCPPFVPGDTTEGHTQEEADNCRQMIQDCFAQYTDELKNNEWTRRLLAIK